MDHRQLRFAATLLLAVTALPASALFKVVGPDGSVTYTDRAPSTPNLRVLHLGRDGSLVASPAPGAAAAAAPAATGGSPDLASMPYDLRQVAARFPVVLYTTGECAACGTARASLQQRGIPFAERTVTTEDDAAALERRVGARSVPALTIGGQVLRGFSVTDWNATLDAAGYPRESRLPRGWTPPAPGPMVARETARPGAAVAAEAAPEAPPPPRAPEVSTEASPPSAIRF